MTIPSAKELDALAVQLKKPSAASVTMSRTRLEILRGWLPFASDECRFLGFPIYIDNTVPPDRINVVDHHGVVLDSIQVSPPSSLEETMSNPNPPNSPNQPNQPNPPNPPNPPTPPPGKPEDPPAT